MTYFGAPASITVAWSGRCIVAERLDESIPVGGDIPALPLSLPQLDRVRSR